VIFLNSDPLTLLAVAVALVVGITCHEFSHALVADILGDHRPRAMGRVSLNPVRHIDPLGAIVFLVAGFGWGRPVMVNPAAMRGGRESMAWVAAAGPIANLLVAALVAVAVRTAGIILAPGSDIWLVLWIVVFLNVTLAIFNLLPIPPLDGYNFALSFLPYRQALVVQRWSQYGFGILLVLLLLSRAIPGGGPLGWLGDLASLITEGLAGA
jgi:Zn-dependent protease